MALEAGADIVIMVYPDITNYLVFSLPFLPAFGIGKGRFRGACLK
jgi:hypothetical protein